MPGMRNTLVALSCAAAAAFSLAMCGGSSDAPPISDAGADVTVDAAQAGDAAADAAPDTRTLDAASADGPSAPSDAPAEVAVDAGALTALCDGIFGAAGRSIASCCSAADMATTAYMGLENEAIWGLDACEDNLTQSLSSGRIRIDETQAAACVAAVAMNLATTPLCWPQANPNRPEELFVPLSPAACAPPVVGLQATGDPCEFDYECAFGDTCIGWTNSSDGVCAVPPPVGETCGPLQEVGVISYTYPFGPHPSCAAGAVCPNGGGTCEAIAGDGGACEDTVGCAEGLVCVNGACAAAYGGPGASCAGANSCQDGLWCAYGDAGGTCTPRSAAGATCIGYENSCSGYCTDDEFDAGVCAALCGSQ